MGSSDYLNSTQNLVHPEWEIVEPTPNIHVLFPRFDKKFFQGKLTCVQLEWSKRMYSCAGICYQKRNRFGMSCIIRLSEPLLKLRPRKDLVETLLHEMIHAYCFVLGIREGNGGHGPHFKKIMNGINKIAGTNISVYHSFHDEVNLYKTHWWKCNGVCRNRPPHFGTVKRSSNRKPGPYDRWWTQHQQDCGGEFVKVKEPSPKRKKANKENDPQKAGGKKKADTTRTPRKWPAGGNISDYFSQPGSVGKSPGPFKKPYTGTAVANPGGRTVVVRKPPTTATTPKPVPNEAPVKKPAPVVPPGSNLKNVKQFKDLDSDSDGSPAKKPNVPLFTGSGHTLGGAGKSYAGQPGNARNSRLLAQFSPKEKKPRIDQLPKPMPQETVDLSDDTDYIFEAIDMDKIKRERQDAIKQDIRDSLADGDDDEIILIDDDYDDEQGDEITNLEDSLTDTSVIDELFSDSDILMEEFNKTNTKIKVEREEDELVSCVVCLKKIKRSEMAAHLDRCYTAFLGEDDDPAPVPTPAAFDPNQPSTSRAGTSSTTKPPQKSKETQPKPDNAKLSQREEHRKILLECGYSEEDIVTALEQMEDTEENQQQTSSSVEKRMLNDGDEIDLTMAAEECACPVCDRMMPLEEINRHLDRCLGV
ncbi:DNA-dependent metalloprotease SPRTN [Culex pipiens pallens]|uniref:DNA-dependent metalloprotease SPRTN n=1 Tax=Culex pipiens pallens TaxID=42434 RepID=UPI0019531D1D|nr:DNA-dependent metalloprotease SPRTN [Culex pipiens pallens]